MTPTRTRARIANLQGVLDTNSVEAVTRRVPSRFRATAVKLVNDWTVGAGCDFQSARPGGVPHDAFFLQYAVRQPLNLKP